MKKQPGPGSSALRKGRYSQPSRIYLVTTVTDQRISWFKQSDLARLMCRSLHDGSSLLDARNLCWVVMPDHVHMLLQLGRADLSKVVRSLKAHSAARLNRQIGRHGRFWYPGYHDHALRYEEDLRGVARYVTANPLRAGLVKRIGDYPFWNAVWL